MAAKPWSEACERNRAPILEVLRGAFVVATHVLEVGAGTGQHAVCFAQALPQLVWQPTDRTEHLPGIAAWCNDVALPNLRAPIALDIDNGPWPTGIFDAVFSANTLHIMSWKSVQSFFRGVGRALESGGVLAVYGPFHYGGKHTSASNARFDEFLHARDPLSGIRDVEAVCALAEAQGLWLSENHALPSNNRTLVWRTRA